MKVCEDVDCLGTWLLELAYLTGAAPLELHCLRIALSLSELSVLP